VFHLAKTAIKDVHIKLPDKKHLQSFIEVLSDALKHVEFSLIYKHGSLRVRLFGEKDIVYESAYVVKNMGKMFIQSIQSNNEGYYTHHLQLIQHIGVKIISLETLSSALEFSGKPSFVNGHELRTKATMKEVQEALSKLYNLMKELPMDVRSQGMKKVLLTVSYCTSQNPSFILDKGLELGFFRQNKNSISVNQAPDVCSKKLIAVLSNQKPTKDY